MSLGDFKQGLGVFEGYRAGGERVMWLLRREDVYWSFLWGSELLVVEKLQPEGWRVADDERFEDFEDLYMALDWLDSKVFESVEMGEAL